MQIKHSTKTATFILDELRKAISYERPAWIVAMGLVRGMMDAGLTEEQAIDVIRSKIYRYNLDGDFGDALENLAYKMGKQWVKREVPRYREECLRAYAKGYGDDNEIWKTEEAA